MDSKKIDTELTGLLHEDIGVEQQNGPLHYVVGIGASAGGLEAIISFFRNIPNDINAAFVVVQHLSPDHKSLMADILSRNTEMRVRQAEEGMEIKPNNVYLIPPKKLLKISNEKFRLVDNNIEYSQPNLAIDVFFHSLAANYRGKSIGIILSGADTDGTRGCKHIKENGGVVMVQDEHSATFSSMPHSVIAAELFDYILPPDKMGQSLSDYINYNPIKLKSNNQNLINAVEEALSTIFSLLKKYYGIDFSKYKRKTVLRCIERRMKICHIFELNIYVDYIMQDSNEAGLLYSSMLICVTKFFRDPEVFKIIEQKVIPALCNDKGVDNPLRVWVPACATGEEVYSLAILIKEYMDLHKLNFEVKIFATDINKSALEYASRGFYPDSIALDVPPERLNRYFIRKEDSYQIIKQIRDMVIFSYHNILVDPPFNKIDLLSCRNLFIYLQLETQKKVISRFHFSLVPKGYLFLGNSESIGDMGEYFATVDGKWKLYKSSSSPANLLLSNSEIAATRESLHQVRFSQYPIPSKGVRGRHVDEINKKLVEQYASPCVIIDKNNQVIHLSGNMNRYLQLPVGLVSLDVLKMVPDTVSAILSTGIKKVRTSNVQVKYNNLTVSVFGKEEKVNVFINTFNYTADFSCIIIIFEQVVDSNALMEGAENLNIEESIKLRIKDLESELAETKDTLRATLEEIETSSEELQSTNEELIASNEELQSTNEELHSVNEELITVNGQYAAKIEELTELNNDLNNFLSSTDIGTIFLDKDLLIRRFTPSIQKEVHLMDFDIGRPISHISHCLLNIDLVEQSKNVLTTRVPKSLEVESSNGSWYVLKLMPYKTEDNIIKGIVITLVDITELKIATKSVQEFSQAIEQSSTMVMVTNAEGIIEFVNKNFEKTTGYSKDEVVGKMARILEPQPNEKPFYDGIWSTIKNNRNWTGEIRNTKKSGELLWEFVSISPVRDAGGNIVRYIVVKEDITERKNIIEKLKSSEEKFGQLFNNSNDIIFINGFNDKGIPNRLLDVNVKGCELLGYTRDEFLSMSFYNIIDEDSLSDIPDIRAQLNKHNYVNFEINYMTKDGRTIPFEVNAYIFILNNEKVVLSFAKDITEKRREQALQKQLLIEEKLLKDALEYDQLKTEFFSNLSHEFRTPLNVILASLKLLEVYIEDSKEIGDLSSVCKHRHIMKQNCYRLLRLVNNLIDITKIDSGFFDINLENHNLVTLIEEITLSVAQYIENKEVTLVFDTDVEEKIGACDPGHIERIMLNLLSNAVKFTCPGDSILVNVYDIGDKIRVSVEDTGTGIKEDKLPIIFERFRQADKSLARNHEGSGIGLSIVKSLVELHGGSISVNSKYGEGTEFIFELPVKPVIAEKTMLNEINKNQMGKIERISIEFSDIYNS